MHHQNRKRAEELQSVVPVGDAVEGIAHGAVEAQGLGGHEAVDGIGGARQGAAAQGTLVEPGGTVLQALHVSFEHGAVGHEMLCKGDGLGSLEVGIAGHDRRLILLCLTAEHLLQLQDLRRDDADLGADVHTEVQRHLVVAAAGGVQSLARLADPCRQQRFHIHVDILVVGRKFHLARLDVREDVRKALDDGLRILPGDDAARTQHLGVGHGAGDILLVEPLVEVDGGIEVVDQFIGLLLKPSAP